MSDLEPQSLRADFLEWTGGFAPETEEDITMYIATSMPSDFDATDALAALRDWMRNASSLQIGRNVDQH